MADYNPRDETNRTTRDERDLPDDIPRIAALKDLGDFKVAEGYPDPRGWSVVEAEGRKVGKVHDLIVDTGQLRTRYLAIRLDKDEIGAKHDRDVLLPVGAARLDDDDDRVLLGSMTRAQLTTLPVFEEGEITRDYEDSVLSRMPSRGATAGAAAAATGAAASDYYASTHFDDRQFFGSRRPRMEQELQRDVKDERTARGAEESRMTRSEEELDIEKRRVQAGEVSVRKHVDTEHVSQPVKLMREDVTIERRPVRADQAGGTIESESEIRIPLTEEQAAINKRAVLKEELVIKKEMKSEEKNVEADLRKERIDVDRTRTEPPDEQKRPRP
jgi:uncharacterized protein (TIGR02271 family)